CHPIRLALSARICSKGDVVHLTQSVRHLEIRRSDPSLPEPEQQSCTLLCSSLTTTATGVRPGTPPRKTATTPLARAMARPERRVRIQVPPAMPRLKSTA